MAYRGAKNVNGVIIAIGNDEGQSGDYAGMGTWCDFTFESVPTFTPVAGAAESPMMFKENGAADGIELRSDVDVLASPQG